MSHATKAPSLPAQNQELPTPATKMDPYKHLHISLNADGSLTRGDIPVTPPTGDHPPPGSSDPALSRDTPLNSAHDTWLRIFTPNNQSSTSKLPVILYFHGGGFILGSAASAYFHASAAQRAAKIPALVLSVEYRLAPEHRLPAAYDDAVDALLWLRDQALSGADPWLRDHADFSECFLMGTSSGANIAYHLGLRSLGLDLGPVKIAGLILNEPFFGGEERTESEAKSEADKVIPLAASDLMWELALPTGASREHEYCDPRPTIAKSKDLPKCLVKGFVGDPLYDRQREFVRMMEEEGASVVAAMEEEGYHGIELWDASKAEALIDDCRSFIYGGGGGCAAGN